MLGSPIILVIPTEVKPAPVLVDTPFTAPVAETLPSSSVGFSSSSFTSPVADTPVNVIDDVAFSTRVPIAPVGALNYHRNS